jgi:hypothetical protein
MTGPVRAALAVYFFVSPVVQNEARVTTFVQGEPWPRSPVPIGTLPVLPTGFAIPLPRAATLKEIVMIASRLLTSSVTALAIVGAVGWAYAQTTPEPATGAQTPMTTPADTAVTPAPEPAAPAADMSEPVMQADRN